MAATCTGSWSRQKTMCARTQHAQISNSGKGNGNLTSESIQTGQILLRKNIQRLWATPSLNISKKLAKIGVSPFFSRQVSTQNHNRERTNRTWEQAIRQHSQLGRKPSEMQETHKLPASSHQALRACFPQQGMQLPITHQQPKPVRSLTTLLAVSQKEQMF